MIQISLTEFLDFVIKSGTPKLTVVKKVKKMHKEKYHPSKDYYRKLRNGIVDIHSNGLPFSTLDVICAGIEKNKQVNYPIMAQAYKKFVGKIKYGWFDPPKTSWGHGDLIVNINPELGLINVTERAIKLYFKIDPLGKREIDIVTHLMELASPKPKGSRQYCVLDIRQGKLISGGATLDPTVTSLVQGEALSFATMYIVGLSKDCQNISFGRAFRYLSEQLGELGPVAGSICLTSKDWEKKADQTQQSQSHSHIRFLKSATMQSSYHPSAARQCWRRLLCCGDANVALADTPTYCPARPPSVTLPPCPNPPIQRRCRSPASDGSRAYGSRCGRW